jgi:hypothetical protein
MRPRRRQVAVLYVPLPNECTSLEEALRARHLDIASMAPDQIETEIEQLRIFLLFCRAPDDWYYERAERLKAARRPSPGRAPGQRPTPRAPRSAEWRPW